MISKAFPKSDMIGALASGLCIVHCVATPFLFIAQSCSVSGCCESSPGWWSSIDYVFIGITFFAVFQSGKNTGKLWMKYAMYVIWVILTALVLNEKFALFSIAELWKYLTSLGLISLHLYNLKYCRCSDDSCCVA